MGPHEFKPDARADKTAHGRGAGARASGAGAPPVSEVERGERVVLFTTAAHRSATTDTWIVPVHGRIYRPTHGRAARAALRIALRTGFGVSPDDASQQLFDERCALMLGDNLEGRRVVIAAGESDHVVTRSGRTGQFRGEVEISHRAIDALAGGSGRIRLQTRLQPRDHRMFAGTALLVEPNGLSVISDIDDTVKVTHVGDRRRMMALTFLRAFEAVPGMAQHFRKWAAAGAAFHFISSSPWPLYEPLQAFLETAGFPPATTSLKNVGLKDRTIRHLLSKATKTKPPAIEALLEAFPARSFVLVGDSGENDAEIYADVASRHPRRIQRILIRHAHESRTGLERAREALGALNPALWQIFESPAELPAALG